MAFSSVYKIQRNMPTTYRITHGDRDQQYDILNQASDEAMNQGKMMESVVLGMAAKAIGGMAQ
jgi:hypothetical protein